MSVVRIHTQTFTVYPRREKTRETVQEGLRVTEGMWNKERQKNGKGKVFSSILSWYIFCDITKNYIIRWNTGIHMTGVEAVKQHLQRHVYTAKVQQIDKQHDG